MNARTSHRKAQAAAFTLIELLTVIAIIAVLMSLLFPAISAAKESGRRAAASTAVRNIVNATKSYYNDYGKYPPVTKNPDDDQAGGTIYSFGEKDAGCKFTNNELFDILRSVSRGLNAGYKMNTRQQKYFEMGVAKDTKNPRDGFLDGTQFTKNQGQLVDPWGWQYCVVLDADDDGTIGLGNFYTDLSGAQNVVRVSSAAFSLGKDGKRGGSGYENRLRKPSSNEAPDDIVSWQ